MALAVAPHGNIEDLLRCPRTGAAMRLTEGAYVSAGDATVRFPVEGGILRAFVPHDRAEADVTQDMKAFYEANPFPNYEDLDNVGSLIQKSLDRGFPEMLNRSIPPHATVLEVGCGTGQLGNFLSIAGRRVLSVDMCLNSLRLAQRFKDHHGLSGVTFGQMNLFRMPLPDAAFDVVLCTGVLHHTNDAQGGFRGLLSFLRPGGHVIVGLYNRYGRAQTRTRRLLAGWIGDRVAALDPYLSRHHVEGEKRQAWVMDQYRNPHESLHTMDEVLRWFTADNISFVRAVPSTIFGSRFEMDYHHSLFEPEGPGSRMDRLLSQLSQMVTDTEGGLFIMIGTKP